MLLPPSAVTAPAPEPSSSKLQIPTGNESLTEDYGEPMQDLRSMGGGVDFFSSLGTQRHKKKKEDKPDPEKVCPSLLIRSVLSLNEFSSLKSVRESSIQV